MSRRIAFVIVALVVSAFSLKGQSVIFLNEEEDGKYTMDASINGVGVRTYYVPESWYASVSSTTYLFLYENGYIIPSDVKGMTVVKKPNGSSTKAGSFVIKNLKIGNVIVQNLPAFVIDKQNVPLIVGNSAFDCFGDVVQEGERLLIYDGIEHTNTNVASAVIAEDPMQEEVKRMLEAKDYENVYAPLTEMYNKGELSSFGQYQYAVVLNVLQKDRETEKVVTKWLEENAGQALNMDFWMYNALGDVYSRRGNTQKALDTYLVAVDTYYQLFSTTEKDVMKSNFRDETLGITLYNIGLLYAKQKNLKKAEYYCAMAAKCGNQPAIEFCNKYHVKLRIKD